MKTTELIKTIRMIDKKLKKIKHQELEVRGIVGLAPSHGDILVNLFNHGNLSMMELAEKIDKDKSTITGLINKLTKLGYVEKYKDERDGRINKVRLTPLAFEKKDDFIEVSQLIVEKFSRYIEEEEAKKVLNILKRINEGL